MNNFSVQGLRPVLVVGYTLWPLDSLRVSFPLMAKVTWMPSKHEMRYLIKEGRKECHIPSTVAGQKDDTFLGICSGGVCHSTEVAQAQLCILSCMN